MATDLPPGTFAHLKSSVPWPERHGQLVHVTDTEGAEHKYPVHGLGPHEVIIFVHEDPLERLFGPLLLANGQPWSCVVTVDDLDVMDPQPVPASQESRTPTEDLVHRLRRTADYWVERHADLPPAWDKLLHEAADEIERLHAENVDLRWWIAPESMGR